MNLLQNERLMFRTTISVLFLSCLALAARGEENSKTLQKAESYVLKETDSDGAVRPLKLISRSFLSWSNPVFGTTEGGLYFWTSEGRPVVMMKTYKTKKGVSFEQWRSFSPHQVTASENANEPAFWYPSEGAKPMVALDDAPAPAAKQISRLVQIKALHRRFKVMGEITNAGGTQELRNYPKPLHRYESESVIDGAVMAFVQGTGPDVLLLLEARMTDEGPKWFYTIGSVGIFKIDVYDRDVLVLTEPRRTAANTSPVDLYDGRRLP
ncbi:MAG: hypothetical protein AB8B91_09220 [Rubripirellula sp.]